MTSTILSPFDVQKASIYPIEGRYIQLIFSFIGDIYEFLNGFLGKVLINYPMIIYYENDYVFILLKMPKKNMIKSETYFRAYVGIEDELYPSIYVIEKDQWKKLVQYYKNMHPVKDTISIK